MSCRAEKFGLKTQLAPVGGRPFGVPILLPARPTADEFDDLSLIADAGLLLQAILTRSIQNGG